MGKVTNIFFLFLHLSVKVKIMLKKIKMRTAFLSVQDVLLCLKIQVIIGPDKDSLCTLNCIYFFTY